MYSLQTLYTQSPKTVRVDAFLHVLHFRQTRTPSQTPLLSYTMKGDVDYDVIQAEVAANQDMILFGAVEDTVIVLDALKQVHDHMALKQYDRIEVTRGGVMLLHILQPHRVIDHFARVDVFDYRKELWRCRSIADYESTVCAFRQVTALVLFACMMGLIWWSKSTQFRWGDLKE